MVFPYRPPFSPIPPGAPRLGVMFGGAAPVLDSRLHGGGQSSQWDQGALQRPGPAYSSAAERLRALYPDPNRQSWGQLLGSVMLPALFGKVAGGSWKDAGLYGMGSAAFNYNRQLDDFRTIEAQIAEAGTRLPSEEAGYDLTRAQTDLARVRTLNAWASEGEGDEVHGTFKGNNGNMWIVTRGGQARDTGVPFKPGEFAPTTGQIIDEYTPETGEHAYVWVDRRDPTNRVSIGPKAPPPSIITGQQKAAVAASKLQQGVASAELRVGGVLDMIDRVKPEVGPWTAGLLGSQLAKIPGSPAYDLAQNIKTIVARIGFDELNQMRRESPTGGALGQVALQELEALRASIASLENSQSPGQLRSNLELVRQRYLDTVAALKVAASREAVILQQQQDYGKPRTEAPSEERAPREIVPEAARPPTAGDYLKRQRAR